MEKITYGLLSKYKTELMGIAAASVLITHASDTIIVDNMPYAFKIMSKMGTLFGSQMYMFFFLSGMGSWFSYEKNKDAITYWKNRVKRTVIPYLLLATVAYAILDLWLQHDVMDFFFDLTCVSFYTKHAGAWYVAVILMLYMIYPLLHVLSKINQKAPVIVALGIGAAYCRLTSNIPFSGNTAYSLENHWGGVAAGSIAFLIGQYCAPKIRNNQKYNMKCLLVLFIVWIVGKLMWNNSPPKLDVFFYMLLGIIGVFLWPIVFEKVRSKRFMELLKRMGGISLEIYLTNIYINSLFGQIGSPFNWFGITDSFNVGRYFCVLILGVSASVFIEKYRLKSR